MSQKFVLAALVATAVVGGGWYLSRPETALPPALSLEAEAQTAEASSEAAAVPDMVMGQEDAPVTVIEYASFTCPHCRNFHDTVWEKFKADYIETGKVKFVYREVYFDKYGLWAAMVARCGGPEKYFPISDIIYTTQREWVSADSEAGIADNLRKIGLTAGIAPDTLDACMKDNDTAKAMVATYQANATRDEVKGTPTFFINGEMHSGEMSYEAFAALVDAKLPN